MSKLLTLLFVSLILSIGYVSACDYGDTTDCDISKTFVLGRVFDSGNSQLVGNAIVTVTCIHNGSFFSKNVTTGDDEGMLMGTYIALFSQDECVSGDEVLVRAVKDNLTGEEHGGVSDWIDGQLIDLDIAIIKDINMVPEFGFILGIVTLLASVGILYVVRKE